MATAIESVSKSHPEVAEMLAKLHQQKKEKDDDLEEMHTALVMERERAKKAESDKNKIIDTFQDVRKVALELGNRGLDDKATKIALSIDLAQDGQSIVSGSASAESNAEAQSPRHSYSQPLSGRDTIGSRSPSVYQDEKHTRDEAKRLKKEQKEK